VEVSLSKTPPNPTCSWRVGCYLAWLAPPLVYEWVNVRQYCKALWIKALYTVNAIHLPFTWMQMHEWISKRFEIKTIQKPREQQSEEQHLSWDLQQVAFDRCAPDVICTGGARRRFSARFKLCALLSLWLFYLFKKRLRAQMCVPANDEVAPDSCRTARGKRPLCVDCVVVQLCFVTRVPVLHNSGLQVWRS